LENRLLFGSVVAGIVTLLPVIYVPSLAENVFYQAAITWEWGLVLGACVIFFFCSEAYKAWMRPHIVRLVKKEGGKRARRSGTPFLKAASAF